MHPSTGQMTFEYDSIHTPTVDQGRNYAEVYVGLTLEEYQLLSQQQTTPMPDLDYQLPIHNLPSDLRRPLYDSLPLSLRFSEAFNFFDYNLTSLQTPWSSFDFISLKKFCYTTSAAATSSTFLVTT